MRDKEHRNNMGNMKRIKRALKRACVIMAGVMILGVGGCGGDDSTPTTATNNSSNTSITTEDNSVNTTVDTDATTDTTTDGENDTEKETTTVYEEIPVITGNINLLTGLKTLSDEAVGKRPVAVMINNIKAALPQHGVAQADIIFETAVEGGLTRLMAIYGDYSKVPYICSVRSCRGYFPAISEGFDAIYVNWGMPVDFEAYVDSLNLTHYEGMNNTGGLFGRDQNRIAAGYSMEHTGYFDGTRLVQSLNKNKWRTDIEADKTGTAFVFNDSEEGIAPAGNACNEVKVDFGTNYSTFVYDEATKTYLKKHNGKAHIDGTTNTQLRFTNLIILETKITTAANNIHKDVDWHGGNGSVGYYISNGTVMKITWSKKDEQSPIKLYDETGNEISINRGKTYIALGFKGKTKFVK